MPGSTKASRRYRNFCGLTDSADYPPSAPSRLALHRAAALSIPQAGGARRHPLAVPADETSAQRAGRSGHIPRTVITLRRDLPRGVCWLLRNGVRHVRDGHSQNARAEPPLHAWCPHGLYPRLDDVWQPFRGGQQPCCDARSFFDCSSWITPKFKKKAAPLSSPKERTGLRWRAAESASTVRGQLVFDDFWGPTYTAAAPTI